MTQEQTALLNRRQLIVSTLVALLVGTLLSVLVVFPVELHYDPTGFGRLTGLLRSAAERAPAPEGEPPADSQTSSVHSQSFHSDLIDIPIGLGAELEYKVAMKQGDVIVYSWSVVGEGKVYFEFHGESEATPEPVVNSYLTGDGAHESHGSLRAPFAGIHGWYLLNDSETPIVVRLQVSGFYELSPKFAAIGHVKTGTLSAR